MQILIQDGAVFEREDGGTLRLLGCVRSFSRTYSSSKGYNYVELVIAPEVIDVAELQNRIALACE